MFECDCSAENPEPPCRGSTLDPSKLSAAGEVTHRGCLLINPASLRHSFNRPKTPFERRRFDWNCCSNLEQVSGTHEKCHCKANEEKPESPPIGKILDKGCFGASLGLGEPTIAIY